MFNKFCSIGFLQLLVLGAQAFEVLKEVPDETNKKKKKKAFKVLKEVPDETNSQKVRALVYLLQCSGVFTT